MKPKFLRQDYMRYSKIGRRRKNLQKWRRPKGMHSKMRKQRKGYPVSPSVGFKSKKAEFGKINGYIPILVHNFKDFSTVGSNNIIILSRRLGAKKRIEMIKRAKNYKLKILNLNNIEK